VTNERISETSEDRRTFRFSSSNTIAELPGKIVNPYQTNPLPARAFEDTVAK
jgi:hypothetical protein